MSRAGVLIVSRRAWLIATASLFVTASISVTHAQTTGAVETIQTLDQALLQVMKTGQSTSFQQRYSMLAPVIDRTFDLPTVLQLCVGREVWDTVPPDQRAQLLQAFRGYTVATYVSNFNSWSGQTFPGFGRNAEG